MPELLHAEGFNGIWYMNQPSGDEYVYKYSGGLGTYCAKHRPLAVYAPEVNRTFFCYGGAPEDFHKRPDIGQTVRDGDDIPGALLHMVSSFDHTAGTVERPRILLDKRTLDAHDNPVMAIDADGHIWIFSTSHGKSRPSFIHRSTAPYDISSFERVEATWICNGQPAPFDNFSYLQVQYGGAEGFRAFLTRYHEPAVRTIGYISSPDGATWSAWQRLAAVGEGHYQVSEFTATKAGTAFNYHPAGKGLNYRTNLYYMETCDGGQTWQAADGTSLETPLVKPDNPARVRDFEAIGENVYMKDLAFDADGRPVILYVLSRGHASGPVNGPRRWQTAHWTGRDWEVRDVTTSDSNYDTGSLYIEADGTWRVIGPTEPGPQLFNPGGELALWLSSDRGATWQKVKDLTQNSMRNHTYARRPIDAHPDFYAFWADGDARRPSISHLYFCSRDGRVFLLPPTMQNNTEKPLTR